VLPDELRELVTDGYLSSAWASFHRDLRWAARPLQSRGFVHDPVRRLG
jgi:hypothetical protein